MKQSKNNTTLPLVLGILFFAVPHRGVDIEDLISIIAADAHPRTTLLQHIQVSSELLKVQLQDFINALDTIKIVSFYETEQSRRLIRVSDFFSVDASDTLGCYWSLESERRVFYKP